jgi:hypothetical protein
MSRRAEMFQVNMVCQASQTGMYGPAGSIERIQENLEGGHFKMNSFLRIDFQG